MEFERGIGSCGQCGGNSTLSSWALGHSIYSRIEEFGEGEGCMLIVDGELASSLEEVDKLQTQIAEYEEEMRDVRENIKELRKEVEESRAQISGVVCTKETAEHRLDMAKQEDQFHNSRIQRVEADNMEMSGKLENMRASLWQLEHEQRKGEPKLENDKHRTLELSQQVWRLGVNESKQNASEVELVRLREQVEQWTAARARFELGREEAIEHRRESDRRHGEEIAQLSERALFAKSARKAQSDLELHEDQMWQFRTGMSSTGSDCVQSDRSNVAQNSVAMSDAW